MIFKIIGIIVVIFVALVLIGIGLAILLGD